MNTIPINSDFGPLLKGVRPFLGTTGQNVTDLTLNFLNLISSDSGQETIQVLHKTMNPKSQGLDGTSPLQFAFILFLILILLILSSYALIPYNSVQDEPAPSGQAVISDEVIGEV